MLMNANNTAAPVLAAAVEAALTSDDLCWYGQYATPEQAGYYRGHPRSRARRIEAAVKAAGIAPSVLKAAHYMGFGG